MSNNVINFNEIREEKKRPKDLLKIRDFLPKYGLKYDFLYKWAVTKKQIKVYCNGGIYLSENDVLEFLNKRALKYGRD